MAVTVAGIAGRSGLGAAAALGVPHRHHSREANLGKGHGFALRAAGFFSVSSRSRRDVVAAAAAILARMLSTSAGPECLCSLPAALEN